MPRKKPTASKSKASSAKSTKAALQTATVHEMANRLNPNSPYYEHEHNKRPHFAVFLGAGASMESGIRSAGQMSEDFVSMICAVECPSIHAKPKKDKWLRDNGYYQTIRDKYASLFERCYPTEVDRREYIESQVDSKVPSLGYIALAHLIKAKAVDTLITTNFDDLIYIAATSFTDVRPVVYSLGGFASEISGTANRPRVLKLHGDFLFSRLKNTEEELKNQDPNMSQQIQQILESYRGLIVIGNSGNDKSILTLLEGLPAGKYLYWCVYRDEKVNSEVEKLLIEKSGWIVRTDGFDKLLNEIRNIVGIDDGVIFNLFEQRRKNLETELEKFNPSRFAEFQSAVEANNAGLLYAKKGELDKAQEALEKAIELQPNFAVAQSNLALVLLGRGVPNKSEELLRQLIKSDPEDAWNYESLGSLLHRMGRTEDALSLYLTASELNPESIASLAPLAHIYMELGDRVLSEKYLGLAMRTIDSGSDLDRARIYSVRRDKVNTLKYLKLSSERPQFIPFVYRTNKLFDWLHNDPQFKKIVGE